MHTYMPDKFEWTDAEKDTLATWVGRKIYLDTGDSINDFEIWGTLTAVDRTADTLTVKSGDWTETVEISRVIHIDLNEENK